MLAANNIYNTNLKPSSLSLGAYSFDSVLYFPCSVFSFYLLWVKSFKSPFYISSCQMIYWLVQYTMIRIRNHHWLGCLLKCSCLRKEERRRVSAKDAEYYGEAQGVLASGHLFTTALGKGVSTGSTLGSQPKY